MSENDIVADIMQRLADSLGAELVPPDVMQRLESEIRRDWAGNICYVPASNRVDRNQHLLSDYRQGKDTQFLALKYRISERHVRRIINMRRK